MPPTPDCIFCKIVAGDIPCLNLFEDEGTLAFMDIFPVSDGHTLVITKQHFVDMFSATPGSLRAVAATAKKVGTIWPSSNRKSRRPS